jgi:hypothetical protein
MSSLSRKLLGLSTVCLLSQAQAADYYFTPELDASVEYHTNIDVDPDPVLEEKTVGLEATVGGILGARTLRSVTELRPRLRVQEYTERDDLQRTNGYLDLHSVFTGQRGSFDLSGSFAKEDRNSAEIVEAGFDSFNPNATTVDQASRVTSVSEERTRYNLRPSMRYALTERVSVGGSVSYDAATFDSDGPSSNEDYDYSQIDGFFAWSVGPRSEVQTGAYAAKYETDSDNYSSDSVGASLGLEHRWSPTFVGTSELRVERSDLENFGVQEKVTDWGLTFGLQRRQERGSTRVTIGRTFSPSGSGVRSEIDEIHLQHDRELRNRWTFGAAVRAFRSRAQGSFASDDDRDYARVELALDRRLTPTWFVGGGYSYTWQKYLVENGGAGDNGVFVHVGYRGLPPQR